MSINRLKKFVRLTHLAHIDIRCLESLESSKIIFVDQQIRKDHECESTRERVNASFIGNERVYREWQSLTSIDIYEQIPASAFNGP
ncbi:hypothetical protein PUN28_014865 [Cardiocondyla obscurior]|uniref:Uncharacterized protein n=1 Tax=Cardiocondyla obscurior TaxID=286306 RepID=A0AAW2EYZ6_9HYME